MKSISKLVNGRQIDPKATLRNLLVHSPALRPQGNVRAFLVITRLWSSRLGLRILEFEMFKSKTRMVSANSSLLLKTESERTREVESLQRRETSEEMSTEPPDKCEKDV